MSNIGRVYNLKKDDVRDDYPALKFKLPNHQVAAVTCVDLRPLMPPVYDQGQLGSCSANAIGAAYEFDQIKQKEASPFVPSRLCIYYYERKAQGTIKQDSGAQLAIGVQVVSVTGVIPETEWPYDISKFTVKPPSKCMKDAKYHTCTTHYKVAQSLGQFKQALISGFPIVIGFSVYSGFESAEVAKSGIVELPAANEQALGGHAVLVVGFDDASSRFIVRNSWGDGWGQKGYFTIPYNYILDANLASDFWVLGSVDDNIPVEKTNTGLLTSMIDDIGTVIHKIIPGATAVTVHKKQKTSHRVKKEVEKIGPIIEKELENIGPIVGSEVAKAMSALVVPVIEQKLADFETRVVSDVEALVEKILNSKNSQN